MSNLRPNCCLKFDFQKVDQHAGGKWLIHDTKRRKDNQLQSLILEVPKMCNKANLRDLIAATDLMMNVRIETNFTFLARVSLKLDIWLWQKWNTLTMYNQDFCIIPLPSEDLNWSLHPKPWNTVKLAIFFTCVTWTWTLTSDRDLLHCITFDNGNQF